MYNKPNYDLIKIIVLLKKHKHGPSAESVFFLYFYHWEQHIKCEDPGSFAAQWVRFELWLTFDLVLQNFQDLPPFFRQRE